MLRLRAMGELGEMDADTVLAGMRVLLKAVREIERDLVDEPASLTWRLSGLREASAGIEIDLPDTPPAVARRVQAAVPRALLRLADPTAETSLARPTLEQLAALAERSAKIGVRRWLVANGDGIEGLLDESVAAAIRERLELLYTSRGSVRGVEENVHTSSTPWYFTLRVRATPTTVRCVMKGDARRELVQQAFGSGRGRAEVTGLVRSTREGVPVTVDVDELRLLPTAPSVRELYGLLPEGSTERVHRIRDGEPVEQHA